MEKTEIQAISFQLVAHVGEASGHFTDALGFARKGDFEAADDSIAQGDAALVEAHKTQTDLLQGEVRGDETEFSLLLVHAQDHLMTTILYERVVKELIEVYKELRHG